MMQDSNEGLSLSSSLQAFLAERGLQLHLDLYAADQAQDPAQ